MKIGIFELSSLNHSVMISNWVKVCRANNWDLKIFTSKEIYEQLDGSVNINKSEIHILKKPSFMEFYKTLGEVNSCDFTVITSLQSYFLHYLVLLFANTKYILTTHNINTWFTPKAGKSIKTLLKYFVRFCFKLKVKGFLVNSKNMLNYVSGKIEIKKPITYLPFSLKTMHEECTLVEEEPKNYSVVYPGMVSVKRKDYQLFLELAANFPDVSFILLGKTIYSEGAGDVVNQIQENQLKNVIYYDDFVSQEEFSQVMKQSHIIFSYINVNYNNDGVTEIYGTSKDSGVSYLMTEYCLPLFINNPFKNFTHLNEGTLYYDNYNQLSDSLKKITDNDGSYKNLKKSIYFNANNDNIAYYSNQMKLFIDSL